MPYPASRAGAARCRLGSSRAGGRGAAPRRSPSSRHAAGRRDQRSVHDRSAKTAIQDYLDALSKGDDEAIARHASCGVFDEIKDKRSDMALANLASDAFRRQFGSAEVTSIDKIVTLSPNQAQVLFTMQVNQPAAHSPKPTVRRVAQLLIQDDQILVCSYLPRAGQSTEAGPVSQRSVERVAAGAGPGGVRVVDREALLLDGVDEVDRGALHVGGAHPVDGQRDAAEVGVQVAVQGRSSKNRLYFRPAQPPG